jgi:hypothetical protein
MSNGIYVFNQFYAFTALLALLLCCWFFGFFKNRFGLKFALSCFCGCLLALITSLMPALAFVVTISFVPSFIYHMIEPLLIAPFIVGLVGFIATWCALTLILDLPGLFAKDSQPAPRWNVTVTAFFVFIFMCFALRSGISGYQIIYHAQQISRYAPTGNDPKRLKEIYQEATRSNDTRMFADVISLLALNHNLSTELLNEIYVKTAQSDLNAISRDRIYRTLTKNPNTSTELFRKLMFSLSQTKTLTASSAATNYISQEHNFSENALLQLAEYPDCEIRRAIIAYPNLSQDVLGKMVKDDPDLGVRHDARKRIDFLHGVSHLENNAETPTPGRSVANVSPDEIVSLINTTQLHQIYNGTIDGDSAEPVLEGLANNCFINDDLARKIYERAAVLHNYSRTAILKALASNPRTPNDILNKLSAEKDLAILRQLASNPNLPLPVMVKLAPYPDCKIRKKIICIPGATMSLLRQFRHDRDESVAVEANERLSQEEDYLQNCVEIKKLNPSCQKYYSTKSPDMRIYPNTSERDDNKSLIPDYQKTIL